MSKTIREVPLRLIILTASFIMVNDSKSNVNIPWWPNPWLNGMNFLHVKVSHSLILTKTQVRTPTNTSADLAAKGRAVRQVPTTGCMF